MRSLAVLLDYSEEDWPSMDLVGNMLATSLQNDFSERVRTVKVSPRMNLRFSKLSSRPFLFNADRLINRFIDYPSYASGKIESSDGYHVCDHSYSQLVSALRKRPDIKSINTSIPIGVYCHDLDTFKCILEPTEENRPGWFRKMSERILRGMQSADFVFHSTEAIRQQILKYQLVDEKKLIHAPYGLAQEFCESSKFDDQNSEHGTYIMHVGSAIERKRLDVLLKSLAEVVKKHPKLKLIQVGAVWTAEQVQLIKRLGIGDSITQVKGISREQLAKLYTHAAAVVIPSEAEGFGLPVLEA